MKLIFSYALILLLPLITLGENWFFSTKHKSMRNAMTLKIKSEATLGQLFFLKKISPVSDFHSTYQANEFKFKKQLFDVEKKKKFSEGTFELALTKDLQKEILFTQLELLSQENKGIQSFYTLFSSPVSFIFFDELESIHHEIFTVSIQIIKNCSHFVQKNISQYLFSIEIPPEYSLSV